MLVVYNMKQKLNRQSPDYSLWDFITATACGHDFMLIVMKRNSLIRRHGGECKNSKQQVFSLYLDETYLLFQLWLFLSLGAYNVDTSNDI